MSEFSDDIVSAYLDGELDAGAHADFDRAVSGDDALARELELIGATRDLVRGLEAPVAPDGFLASLVDAPSDVVDLGPVRARRTWRSTVGLAAAAVAAAVLLAVVVPAAGRSQPALATDVRLHQAGAAASGDPMSGLAPLGTPMGLGR